MTKLSITCEKTGFVLRWDIVTCQHFNKLATVQNVSLFMRFIMKFLTS